MYFPTRQSLLVPELDNSFWTDTRLRQSLLTIIHFVSHVSCISLASVLSLVSLSYLCKFSESMFRIG